MLYYYYWTFDMLLEKYFILLEAFLLLLYNGTKFNTEHKT